MTEHAPAVVTGAASGIGAALARQLSAQGRNVFLVDVESPDEVAHEIGGVPVRADVTNPAQMEALAEQASDARFVCLNAGVLGATLGPPWEVPPDEWARVLDVNLGGVVNGLRAFVPRLLASGDAAHILITASLAGLVTFPWGGAYSASKHAAVAVAEQAAFTLASTPIGVSVLCPDLVKTGMSVEGEDPDRVAADALQGCAAGDFAVVPDVWRAAVTSRGARIAAADVPHLPKHEAAP